MSSSPNDYDWFIEPKNPYTNLVLAGMLPAENFHPDCAIEDGSERQLWLLQRWAQAEYLAATPDVNFHTYVRKGRFGKIHRVDFMIKKHATADTRRMIEQMFEKLGIKSFKPKTAN